MINNTEITVVPHSDMIKWSMYWYYPQRVFSASIMTLDNGSLHIKAAGWIYYSFGDMLKYWDVLGRRVLIEKTGFYI